MKKFPETSLPLWPSHSKDIILNVSLTGVTMLWNVSDQLARSHRAMVAADPNSASRASGLALLAAAGWKGGGGAAGEEERSRMIRGDGPHLLPYNNPCPP